MCFPVYVAQKLSYNKHYAEGQIISSVFISVICETILVTIVGNPRLVNSGRPPPSFCLARCHSSMAHVVFLI